MKLIVSVDEQWGIGQGGGLLVRIPEDLARFKAMTMGKAVVMGRRTLATLPGGMPLKGRVNIVLSRDTGFMAENALTARSLEDVLAVTRMMREQDVFVIGGQSVYEQLLHYCSEAYVTHWTRGAHEAADAFFPNLNERSGWMRACASETYRYGDIDYCYVTYRNEGYRGVKA